MPGVGNENENEKITGRKTDDDAVFLIGKHLSDRRSRPCCCLWTISDTLGIWSCSTTTRRSVPSPDSWNDRKPWPTRTPAPRDGTLHISPCRSDRGIVWRRRPEIVFLNDCRRRVVAKATISTSTVWNVICVRCDKAATTFPRRTLCGLIFLVRIKWRMMSCCLGKWHRFLLFEFQVATSKTINFNQNAQQELICNKLRMHLRFTVGIFYGVVVIMRFKIATTINTYIFLRFNGCVVC